jgi:dTDP-4-amino-4,6-dideoxygalactose transaminase
VIKLDLEKTAPRRQVFDALRHAGVNVNVHYIPVHLQPYYRRMGFKPDDYPVAEAYYAAAVSLPMFYNLTEEEQDYVVDQVSSAIW